MSRTHEFFRIPGAVKAVALPAFLSLLVSCGGGGDGSGDVSDSAAPRPFAVVSGGAACGRGCDLDNAAGDGPGGGGDGGGGGAGDSGGVGAGGSLSALRNVIASVTKPDGTLLGTARFDGNLVSIYPGTYTGPFILRVADDGSGTGAYYDEARKAWLPIGSLNLHVLVPALRHHIGANSLAEAAYQWAIAKYGSEAALTADLMDQANNIVRDAFNAKLGAAYQIADVTDYASPVDSDPNTAKLPNTFAGRYGALLSALPIAALEHDSSLAAPAIAFKSQLVQDILDNGKIDLATGPAYDSNLSTAVSVALKTVLNTWGSSGLPASTFTHDATAQFQAAQNPGPIWTYGYSSTGSSPLILFDTALKDATANSLWVRTDHMTLNAPSIWFNASSSTQFGVAPGQLSMHPGVTQNGDFAVLRFTALVAARYRISGQFFAGDVGSTSAWVIRNGALTNPLAQFGTTDNSPTFDVTTPLAPGETVDFMVGNNGDFTSDNTPVTVTIVGTP